MNSDRESEKDGFEGIDSFLRTDSVKSQSSSVPDISYMHI